MQPLVIGVISYVLLKCNDMRSNFYLPGLNGDESRSDATQELSFYLSKCLCPMSYLFYNDTSAYSIPPN
jgi:hypothetical protein